MAVDRDENINCSRDIGTLWVIFIFGFALLMGLAAAQALLARAPNQEVVELFDQVNGPG